MVLLFTTVFSLKWRSTKDNYVHVPVLDLYFYKIKIKSLFLTWFKQVLSLPKIKKKVILNYSTSFNFLVFNFFFLSNLRRLWPNFCIENFSATTLFLMTHILEKNSKGQTDYSWIQCVLRFRSRSSRCTYNITTTN